MPNRDKTGPAGKGPGTGGGRGGCVPSRKAQPRPRDGRGLGQGGGRGGRGGGRRKQNGYTYYR